MRSRWIYRLAWGGLLLSLLIGFINAEHFGFHVAEALLYAALLYLFAHRQKTGLLFGLSLGLIWLVVHVGLTRGAITSAFGLWIDWKIALETNPGGPISILLVFLNSGLASDCFYDYLKRSEKAWIDLKILAGWIGLIALCYFCIFWLFQPHWLNAILTYGVF